MNETMKISKFSIPISKRLDFGDESVRPRKQNNINLINEDEG